MDSDFEELKHALFDGNLDISLSLCGNLDTELSDEAFNRNVLRFDDVCADPKLFENPNLAVKINGKFYNWATACPMVMSLAAFQRHLPQNVVDNLCAQYMPMHEETKKTLGGDKSEGRGYSSWFSWRRPSQPNKTPQDLAAQQMQTEQSVQQMDNGSAEECTIVT